MTILEEGWTRITTEKLQTSVHFENNRTHSLPN